MAEQNARIEDGSGNIIVQAVHSTVTVGAPATLRIFPWHRRPRAAGSDVALLDPFTLSVPFVGRAAELARLQDWLRSPAPVSARCLTGRAGSGKTRLALKLCACAEALNGGWDAGFLGHAELQRFFAKENIGTWGWRRPTLIILDYAAGCGQVLKPWLEELSQNPGHPERALRLLLLERFADDGAGWWAELTGTGWSNAGIPALFDPPAPEPLAELAAEDRGALVVGLLEKAGSMADAGRIEAQAVRAGDTDALDLLMAGLTAAKGIAGGNPAGGRTGMAFALAGHERNRLDAIARDRKLDADLLAHLAAMLTLQGGAAAEDALDMAAAETEALRSGSDPRALYTALCDAYAPGAGERLPPILPDLIGEAFVLNAFERVRLSAAAQKQAVCRAYKREESAALAFIVRTAQDFEKSEIERCLGWLAYLIENCNNIAALMRIANSIPEQTLVLRKISAVVNDLIVKYIGMIEIDRADGEIIIVRTVALNDLSVRLRAIGEWRKALDIIDGAVKLFRSLTIVQQDTYRETYALLLRNLSISLLDVNRNEEALASIEEAVDIYHALAQENPEKFTVYLAISLNNEATTLATLRLYDRSLETVNRAIDVISNNSQLDPKIARLALAELLDNLPLHLVAMDKLEEAYDAAKKAIETRREMVTFQSSAFAPDLALALHNLSYVASYSHRFQESLDASREAVDIQRKLASEISQGFLQYLASSLVCLARSWADLANWRAVILSREAVNIYRDLTTEQGAIFVSARARALAALANYLEAIDQNKSAMESDRELIASLIEDFLREPRTLELEMRSACGRYLHHSFKAGREPDEALLAPVIAVFQRLRGGEAEEQATEE